MASPVLGMSHSGPCLATALCAAPRPVSASSNLTTGDFLQGKRKINAALILTCSRVCGHSEPIARIRKPQLRADESLAQRHTTRGWWGHDLKPALPNSESDRPRPCFLSGYSATFTMDINNNCKSFRDSPSCLYLCNHSYSFHEPCKGVNTTSLVYRREWQLRALRSWARWVTAGRYYSPICTALAAPCPTLHTLSPRAPSFGCLCGPYHQSVASILDLLVSIMFHSSVGLYASYLHARGCLAPGVCSANFVEQMSYHMCDVLEVSLYLKSEKPQH